MALGPGVQKICGLRPFEWACPRDAQVAPVASHLAGAAGAADAAVARAAAAVAAATAHAAAAAQQAPPQSSSGDPAQIKSHKKKPRKKTQAASKSQP